MIALRVGDLNTVRRERVPVESMQFTPCMFGDAVAKVIIQCIPTARQLLFSFSLRITK